MDNDQIGLFDGDDSNGSDDVNEQRPSVEEPRYDSKGLLVRPVKRHSADKAHLVSRYANTVGNAMKSIFPNRWWVELFAGPGRLRFSGANEDSDGSPLQALEINYPFSGYIFVDSDRECVESLRKRTSDYSNVHILQGDANSDELIKQIMQIVPKRALLILYCDPQGLHLHFKTIRVFAENYKCLDLIINFPVPAIIRNLRAGNEELVADVLNHRVPSKLISRKSRAEAGEAIREHFLDQLREFSFRYSSAEVVRSDLKNAPIYDLLFVSRKPKAKELFDNANEIGPGGQRTMRFEE